MKIKLKKDLADGIILHENGKILDVGEDRANLLINNGYAELLKAEKSKAKTKNKKGDTK